MLAYVYKDTSKVCVKIQIKGEPRCQCCGVKPLPAMLASLNGVVHDPNAPLANQLLTNGLVKAENGPSSLVPANHKGDLEIHGSWTSGE